MKILTLDSARVIENSQIDELARSLSEAVCADDVTVNLENVDFFSAAAIGKLIHADRHAKALHRRLAIRGVRPEIYEVFQITRLDRILDVSMEPIQDANAASP